MTSLDVIAEDRHMFYEFHFAAMWVSLDVAAPGDCSSAIKPKIEHRPIFLQAIPERRRDRQLWTRLCFERLAKILAALIRQRGTCTSYPGHDGHLSSTWYS